MNIQKIPALFDMHVHFRDPGQTHKETLETGAAAAAAGGFSGVLCMPNTSPPIDSPKYIKYISQLQENVDIYAAGCITRGMKGEELTDFYELKAAGAIALTDDGRPVENTLLMKQALIEAEKCGILIMAHSEDFRFPYPAPAAEDAAVCRDVLLSEETGCPIHITHVSTACSLDFIRQAKKRGVKVSCDTAPHYFSLTKEDVGGNANFKMNPPLRTENDKKAVIEAIKDGTVDAIITDHAPHTKAEKEEFDTAPCGIIGLETSLAVTLDVLYHKNNISLSKIVELMSTNPRKLLGLPPERRFIEIDLDKEWIVDPETFLSMGRNCPFAGKTLKGKLVYK